MPADKGQRADKGASNSVAATPTERRQPDGASKPTKPRVTCYPDRMLQPAIRRCDGDACCSAQRLLCCWQSILVFGIPWIRQSLNTVSTDDAYVNGHVTFVAARVPGQVSKVLVDDNYRVKKGDLLVELDKEPYETAVAIKQAAVDIAKANLVVAEASVRSVEAKAQKPVLGA